MNTAKTLLEECIENATNDREGTPSLQSVIEYLAGDSSCYEEETGETQHFGRWACLFRFTNDEALLLANSTTDGHDWFTEDCHEVALVQSEYTGSDLESPEYFADLKADYEDWLLEGEEEEQRERDNAISECLDEIAEIQDSIKERNGRCTDCEAMMINGVYCHETGCLTDSRIRNLRKQIERIEEGY